MKKVVVIGAGAAGMMAASAAARLGAAVDLFDKNEKTGKKIYITGKGRCNLTNDCAEQELMDAVCSNSKFLYSAFDAWSNKDVIRFFEELGMKTKTERGGRVFPVSDHASDVTAALERDLRAHHVGIHLNKEVKSIAITYEDGEEVPSGSVKGVRLKDGTFVAADAVIVATGGLSYQTTGSTGDGYRFAQEAGMKVTECSPSLVPMVTLEDDAVKMQGLSLKNVSVRVLDGKKVLYEEFGEMMFTHFGVTGPLILTASTKVRKQLRKKNLTLRINLKPAITRQQLDARLVREFAENANRELKNVLGSVYPAKMVPVMIARSDIPAQKPARDITKEERRRLVELTQALDFTLTGLRGFSEAIITAGGVSVKEVRPDTMESKKVAGLYFAGEVLDLDAVTGGFNLQIAWSTGHAAGVAAAGADS